MKKFGDRLGKVSAYFMSSLVIIVLILILFVLIRGSFPAFRSEFFNMFSIKSGWFPTSENAQYGLINIILGTIYVSFLAVILALLFGLITAFFISYYCRGMIKDILVSFIDMISGIPSVIFGFLGLELVVKYFARNLELSSGQSVLSASLVLALMLLPYIVATCLESIDKARKTMEMTALGLGISKEMTMFKIIIPSIKKAIISSAMMAFGRGLGETMAVMMLVGNSPIRPSLLGRAQTIPALTALEMGNVEYKSMHLSVLYAANLILILILVLVYFVGNRIGNKNEKKRH